MYFKAGNTVFPLSGPLVGILKINYPAAELRGIRCHAGLDPASSLILDSDFYPPLADSPE